MSFLTINDYAIRTSVGGNCKPRMVGTDARAASGTLRRTVRAYKREWQYSTTRLPAATVEIVRGLVMGLGNVWPFNEWQYSTKGLAPSGTPVFAQLLAEAADGDPMVDYYRGSESKYGAGSVEVCDGTTNLLSSTAANCSDAADWTGISGSTPADESTETIDGDSIAVDIAGFGDGAQHNFNPNAANGTDLAATIWVKSTSATALTMTVYDNTNAAFGSVGSFTVAADTWTRIQSTITISGSTCTSLDVRVYRNGSVSTPWTIYLDRAQVEVATTYTAWYDGTRAAPSFVLTDLDWLKQATGLTVAFWARPPRDTTPSVFFDAMCSDGSEAFFRYDSGGSYTWYTSTGAAVSGSQAWSGVSTWDHITAVIDGSGTGTLYLYRNGVLLGSDTDLTIVFADLDSLYIGMQDIGNACNTGIDDLIILPYAADATLAAALAGRTTAHPALPVVHLSGDVVGNTNVEVLGEVDKVAGTPYGSGGSWYSTGRSVGFKLLER